jgi:chromosome segregation ATPase
MISKIRELVHIKEDIKELSNDFSDLKKDVNSFKADIESLKKSVNDSNAKHEDFLKKFEKNLDVINESKEELKKEAYDFKLLKSQLQNKILHKFEEELGKELKVNMDKLKEDYDGYAELKSKVDGLKPKMDELNKEISALSEVSKSIKKEDFELTKFSNQIFKADSEKLELMKKIDTLERLIAKMRRNSR